MKSFAQHPPRCAQAPVALRRGARVWLVGRPMPRLRWQPVEVVHVVGHRGTRTTATRMRAGERPSSRCSPRPPGPFGVHPQQRGGQRTAAVGGDRVGDDSALPADRSASGLCTRLSSSPARHLLGRRACPQIRCLAQCIGLGRRNHDERRTFPPRSSYVAWARSRKPPNIVPMHRRTGNIGQHLRTDDFR